MKTALRILLIFLVALTVAAQTRVATHGIAGGHKVSGATDTIPPTTSITSPANLATVSGTITVTATASDNVGVVKVELYVDSVLYLTLTSSPYNYSWNTTTYSNASHTLQTKAYDAAGNIGSSTVINVTVSNTAGTFLAALPTNWVDNSICNTLPTVTLTLGTSTNAGPNCHNGTSPACGGTYTNDIAGLTDAIRNWRDNADQLASASPHFADVEWLVQVPAQSGGTYLHGSTYDSNGALISMPGKFNGTASQANEPTKCLVIDSTTPNTTGQMVCGHGLPGFGGTRNPGCATGTDKGKLWKLEIDSATINGQNAIYFGTDVGSTTNYANHIVIKNVEVDVKGGSSPSLQGSHVPSLVRFNNGQGVIPNRPWSKRVGLMYSYIHGNDPGDANQPLVGTGLDGAGTCLSWGISGTVNTTNSDASHGQVTWVSGSFYGGETMTAGTTLTINNVQYTLSSVTNNTTFIINGQPGTQTAATFSMTDANGFITGVPSAYRPGCGDDVQNGINVNCDYCWIQWNYIEKVHWWNSESHAISGGFANGPVKIVGNWMEGASAGLFSGGGPVDTNGGPQSDQEVRHNYMGRDLNYRLLSARAGQSPDPPFGCASQDATASHHTCPFNWAIKNSLEAKLGHRLLFDGNIIENSWPDGQSGFCILFTVRVCSGGAVCGIYDQTTGLPLTFIDNIRFSNNWVRNCAQPVEMSNRSQKPGDGGGVSAPIQNVDYINNLWTNISDTTQFGNPGGSTGNAFQVTDGQDNYVCTMSVFSGSGAGAVAHGACQPYQSIMSPKVTSVIRSGGVVTVKFSVRADPLICPTTPSQCIAAGQTAIMTSAPAGWNGTFSINDANGTNFASDGTGGTQLRYSDTQAADGTLCNSSTACIGLGFTFTIASLGFKLHDISIGDGVYMTNNGTDTSCTTNNYAVGATASVTAVSPTSPTGLDVYYPSPNATGTATCILSNGVGFPKHMTFQNNTVLSNQITNLNNFNLWWQPIDNQYFSNIFATNDASHFSDVFCNQTSTEGTASFACWDSTTFQFYHNVMESRSSLNWSVVNCPGGTCTNGFPATVNCATATADSTCIGFAGFMGPSPTVTYPSGACATGSAPFNCPMMALPWANNLTLTNLGFAASSVYSTYGASTSQINTAITNTQYTCPTGANCGTHGPYPD